jgi:hypothetical protein
MKRVARTIALSLVALVALPGWALAQEVPQVPDPTALIQTIRQQLSSAPSLDGILGQDITIDTDQLGLGEAAPFRVTVSVQQMQLALLKTIPRTPDVGGLFDLGMPGLPALPGGIEAEACSLIDREVSVPPVVIRICISVGPMPPPELPGLPEVPEVPGLPGVPGVPAVPAVPAVPGVPGLPELPVDPVDEVEGVIDTVDEATGGAFAPILDPVGNVIDTVTGILGL